ncbi:MAG: PEP-CTERM sorting domain-containing protein [Rubrivivax sp.]|nr:PEP-CTERM sorting domain-containing protein [Rubrivivax sp.]MDP3612153.1 PEP-CTERM sorting domain-containing protein [Rubrivivax sp.]
MKSVSSLGAVVGAAVLSMAFVSQAQAKGAAVITPGAAGAAESTVVIDMAGWSTWGGFGSPSNSEVFLNLGAGSVITGFSYSGLAFSTLNGSFLSEMTLSVNNIEGTSYMDWAPSLVDAGGSFGPGAGSWGGAEGGEGPFGPGGSFVVSDGQVWVTVYEGFDDPFGDGGATIDATITAGLLTIMYQPIPEPATYAMMALGLFAVGAAARRRKG